MKVVLYTVTISPHQLPLATEILKNVASEGFRYVSVHRYDCEREKQGWDLGSIPDWVIYFEDSMARQWLESADVLVSGIRDIKLFKIRASKGIKTFYMSERWFKPPWRMLRLLHPQYFLLAWRIVSLIKSGEVFYLPIGIYAVQDMARLCGLFSGDWRCLFRAPKLNFDRNVMGCIEAANGQGERYCTDRMRMWAYFVEPSSIPGHFLGQTENGENRRLHVLWVGRMLSWKKVDTLIQAVKVLLVEGVPIHLRIVGTGPEESRLKRLAGLHLCEDLQKDGISFYPQVPIHEVRYLMRQADVYVLPSNDYEGWGAVVNEAMTEGCCVVGTRESGSSTTMIEDGVNGLLFDTGDVQGLRLCLKRLMNDGYRQALAQKGKETLDTLWSPANAATQFLEFCRNRTCGTTGESK